MHLMVKELRYARLERPFIGSFKPYVHQWCTLERVRQALKETRTVCIENTSITGSGKTLANFAAAILYGHFTCGVYPTNELIQDQDISLHRHFSSGDKRIIDKIGLDLIQGVFQHQSRAAALDWATGDAQCRALLTNPDILYLVLSNLYGQMFTTFQKAQGSLAFQNVLNNYPIIVFDEFHLYTPKQIAHAAFIMGLARELVPNKPHIFIFSSATPQPLFKDYAHHLGLDVQSVSSPPDPQGCIVCEPLQLHILKSDLQRWQGGETIRENLDSILDWADKQKMPAKGVFIVDSVYDARMLADLLRQRYPAPMDVGEVHGFMDPLERDNALRCRFSVGTTTIDVGVDLVDEKAKDFLVCEARSAAQAIQRLGRLGRRGREPDAIPILNTAWLVVPEYVHAYVQNRLPAENAELERNALSELLNEAYLPYEDFGAYTRKYAPFEAIAACERIKHQYQSDVKAGNIERLQRLVATLHCAEPPVTQEQAEQFYRSRLRGQYAVWKKFGTPIHGSDTCYLGDLESFRGGFESDFEVAIYDDRDRELGMKPLKYYNLFFTLRRTECQEMTKKAFTDLITKNHPREAAEWVAELERDHPGLLGYIRVYGLIEGKARRVYCQLPKDFLDEEAYRMPLRLPAGKLTLGGTELKLLPRGGIQEALSKQERNCWIAPRTTFAVGRGQQKPLPALFTIYPLLPVRLAGTRAESEWSIAFGINAFLLESIFTKSWWAKKPRQAGGAIFC